MSGRLPTCWYCAECGGIDCTASGFMHISGYANPCSTKPIEVPLALPGPSHQLAILDAMNLDVSERTAFADAPTGTKVFIVTEKKEYVITKKPA